MKDENEVEEWQIELVRWAEEMVKDAWELNRPGEEFPSRKSLTKLEEKYYVLAVQEISNGFIKAEIWSVLVGEERKRDG